MGQPNHRNTHSTMKAVAPRCDARWARNFPSSQVKGQRFASAGSPSSLDSPAENASAISTACCITSNSTPGTRNAPYANVGWNAIRSTLATGDTRARATSRLTPFDRIHPAASSSFIAVTTFETPGYATPYVRMFELSTHTFTCACSPRLTRVDRFDGT